MGVVVAVFVALAVGKAVLLWDRRQGPATGNVSAMMIQPSPETKCYLVSAKCREEGQQVLVNRKGKARETETGVFAFDWRWTGTAQSRYRRAAGSSRYSPS